MPRVRSTFGPEYYSMACLPQNVRFQFRGLAAGIDLPLEIELLEQGKNTIHHIKNKKFPAQPFNRLFHLAAETSGEIVMEQRRFPLRSNRMYLIPLERPFRMRFYPAGAFGYVHFTAKDTNGLDLFRNTRDVLERPILPALKTLMPLTHALDQPADALILSSAYASAIAMFADAPDINSLWLHASMAQPMQQVLALIRERNSARLRVRDIAAAVSMSPTALYQSFRRAFGHSLKFHLSQDLLQRAMHELIGSNKMVSQIAAELGYARAVYLTIAFRRVFGLSPLKYRAVMHPRATNRRLYGAPIRPNNYDKWDHARFRGLVIPAARPQEPLRSCRGVKGG